MTFFSLKLKMAVFHLARYVRPKQSHQSEFYIPVLYTCLSRCRKEIVLKRWLQTKFDGYVREKCDRKNKEACDTLNLFSETGKFRKSWRLRCCAAFCHRLTPPIHMVLFCNRGQDIFVRFSVELSQMSVTSHSFTKSTFFYVGETSAVLSPHDC